MQINLKSGKTWGNFRPNFAGMLRKGERILVLASLPELVRSSENREEILAKAAIENPFFIPRFSSYALEQILGWHNQLLLENWLKDVSDPIDIQKIGLVLAGNIPLVGWHDLMSVFASGHQAVYKPSSQDSVMINWLINLIIKAFPETTLYFKETQRLNDVDALIATGSNQTATHFEYYFRNKPRLIRGSKSSLGIIYGFETQEELTHLADDIMFYFGLGCRNVTHLLVPAGYDFQPFMLALEKYRFFTDHHRYVNNCIYHKAIFLMNSDPFLENDLLIVRPSNRLFSPVGVLHYQEYASLEEARALVAEMEKNIQCIVSHAGQWPDSIPFGKAQSPGIHDYADGINTLEFLQGLTK